MIKIREEVDRIAVAFPYNPDYIAKIKTIEGYKWHPEEKCWSVPYSDGAVERILSIFSGEEVENEVKGIQSENPKVVSPPYKEVSLLFYEGPRLIR